MVLIQDPYQSPEFNRNTFIYRLKSKAGIKKIVNPVAQIQTGAGFIQDHLGASQFLHNGRIEKFLDVLIGLIQV